MKRFISLLSLVSLVSLFGAFPVQGVAADLFTRSLRLGDAGDDVKALQEILNQDSRTQVAQFGAGSPGQETNRFGLLTKAAAVRFQELYASELLEPIGLRSGTGFIGARTLKKLNELAKGIPGKSAVTITSIAPSRAEAGAILTVTGIGFGSGQVTTSMAGRTIAAVSDPTLPDTISFLVPADLPVGLYAVSLSTPNGISNELKVRVANSRLSGIGPNISQLSPSRGGYGTTVNILGSGFATTPTNTLYVGYDKIENIASPDGKTISFTIPRIIPHINFRPEELAGVDAWLPFWVYVQNTNGESNSQLFTFTFYTY